VSAVKQGRVTNERKILDLRVMAADEEAVAELAVELEQATVERPGKLWTEEFSASGEKTNDM
jgi:hypothetical protein